MCSDVNDYDVNDYLALNDFRILTLIRILIASLIFRDPPQASRSWVFFSQADRRGQGPKLHAKRL